MNMKLSVILPIRNEADTIPELISRLLSVLNHIEIDYEIIFVTDINTDNTLEILKRYSIADSKIKIIKLSNSFGQHVAVRAGLDHCESDAAVIMDADLEMFPEDIPKLYSKLNEGFDIVYGVNKHKNRSFLKDLASKIFNKIMNLLSDENAALNTDMFRIISRKVIDEIIKFREQKPSLTYIMGLINLPAVKVELEFGRRSKGRSNYNFKRQMNMAIDSFLSFSTKPVRFISLLGFFTSLVSFLYLLIVLIQKFFDKYTGIGLGTILVLIIFFGGLQLFAIGIIGEYIGRIFIQSKNRPLYIVEELFGDFNKSSY
jgi:glycosyltransferase involved in cell wall biosynthesis